MDISELRGSLGLCFGGYIRHMLYFWKNFDFFCEIDYFSLQIAAKYSKITDLAKTSSKHEKLVSGSSRSIRCTRHDVGDVSCMTRPCSILILIIRCRNSIYFDFCQVRFRSKTSSFSIQTEPIDAKPNHPKITSYELLNIEISAS